MRRREFITLFGGGAAMWPLAAHAQQRVPVIGFLNSASAESWKPFVSAFRQGLDEAGFAGRKRALARQFMFFDAPVGLIFTVDRLLVPACFVCLGIFLQTIMLAAKGRGIDTCPQQLWSSQFPVLRKELGISESDMVVAGMSMGYADNDLPVNHMVLDKFGPEKFAKFVDI
jgi:nitroreductase